MRSLDLDHLAYNVTFECKKRGIITRELADFELPGIIGAAKYELTYPICGFENGRLADIEYEPIAIKKIEVTDGNDNLDGDRNCGLRVVHDAGREVSEFHRVEGAG